MTTLLLSASGIIFATVMHCYTFWESSGSAHLSKHSINRKKQDDEYNRQTQSPYVTTWSSNSTTPLMCPLGQVTRPFCLDQYTT